MMCLSAGRALAQRGIAIAEWAMAAVLGALVLAAALAWLQSSVVLAMSQRVPAQLQESSYWLTQRLDRLIVAAGAGGVHPLGLDDPALSAWWPSTLANTGRVASDQLLLQRLIESDNDDFDCEGRRTAVGARQISRLFLRRDTVSPLWALACDSGYCDMSGCHALGDAGIVLMTGVSAIVWRVLAPATGADAAGWQRLDSWRTQQQTTPITGLRLSLWTTSEDQYSRARRWQAPITWSGPDISPLIERRAQHTLAMTWELSHAP
ncbi:MAG: hypothetical protein ABIR53_03015 [Paraperlucidibaca sp.]